MTDRFSKAVEELEKKSPFVCVSCGHHEIAEASESIPDAPGAALHDRFSEAVTEMEEKSAFVCKSCGHPQPIRPASKH